MAASVTTRFAPSPTGHLHLGNARIAIINCLLARRHQGRWLLRVDDTDPARSREEFLTAICEDLRWLDLSWDECIRQSRRTDLYAQAFAELEARGRVYPCYETPEELAQLRRQQQERGLPPRYDRRARALSDQMHRELARSGRRPYWRFLLEDREVAFRDLVFGERRVPPGALGDPVVRREDGGFTYLFASVVDDVALGITHVVRGEDHLTNTAAQIQIFEALGAAPPRFAHLPLLLDAEGRPLAKRHGGLTLRELRARGLEPRAVVAWLARLGTGRSAGPEDDWERLCADLDLARYGRQPARVDLAELERLSARVLHRLSFAEVRPRLVELGLADADPAFWALVRGNLSTLAEARGWWQVVRGVIEPVVVDPDLLREAAARVPDRIADPEEARRWLRSLQKATGRRGRELYRPLRLALTGREHGPELHLLLPELGAERIRARLEGRRA